MAEEGIEYVVLPVGVPITGKVTYCSGATPEVYNLVLVVGTSTGLHLEGTITWPSLGGATTKFRGDVRGRKLALVEYEAISGADQVSLPTAYEVIFEPNSATAHGKVTDGEPADVELTCLAGPPALARSQAPQTTMLEATLTVASDGSQQARLTWSSSDGTVVAKTAGVARRQGNDLVISELSLVDTQQPETAATTSGPEFVDARSDELLASTVLPFNEHAL